MSIQNSVYTVTDLVVVVLVKEEVASQYLIRVQSGEGRRTMEQCRSPLLRSNELGEGGEGEAGGVGTRNRGVARSRGETDGAQQMDLLEANLTQVSLEAEDILQPDPEEWCVGQGEGTGEEDIVRNRNSVVGGVGRVKGRVQKEARAGRPSCPRRRHTGCFSMLGTASGEGGEEAERCGRTSIATDSVTHPTTTQKRLQ